MSGDIGGLPATVDDGPEENFLIALHRAVTEIGGVDLELPDRTDVPREVDLADQH